MELIGKSIFITKWRTKHHKTYELLLLKAQKIFYT